MSTVYIRPENITEDRVLLLPDTSGALVPPGSLLMFAGSVAPQGYLLCDGSSVARSEYAVLFDVIGTTYGVGDGTTTFNVPDLRSRHPMGAGTGGGLSSRSLGEAAGAETVTLTTPQLPSHTHTGTVDSNGSHAHGITDPGHAHTQNTINDDYNNSGANPPGFSADSAGSVTWSNINANVTGITVNANGDHTHTFTSNSTGGGQPHSNLAPYLVVNFIIKT